MGVTSAAYSCVAIFAPIGAPGVFDDPFGTIVDCVTPANNLHDMISVELKCILGSMIGTLCICKEIRIGLHLRHNRPIFNDFTFDIEFTRSETEIINPINIIIQSTLIGFKVINITLILFAIVFHAFIKDKSFVSSELENLVDISA